MNFAVTDSFTIGATLGYSDAKLGSDEPDLGGAKGTQLPNSSKWAATVNFTYDFNIGSIPWYFAGSWRYKGKVPVGFEGYTDSDGMFWQSSQPRYIIDAYSLVNLNVGFSTERFDASVYVDNVLDEYAYYNYATNNTGFALGVPTRPRTIGVVLRAKF